MGFTKKHGKLWCVHNEPTGRVISARGRKRCYKSKRDADRVLAALDCKYTGRRCAQVPKGFRERDVEPAD
jgi:hypothetical protein